MLYRYFVRRIMSLLKYWRDRLDWFMPFWWVARSPSLTVKIKTIILKFTTFSQIRYTGFRDRPMEERKNRFAIGCREGHTEIAFTNSGINIQLIFNPNPMMYHHHHHHMHHHFANFERELDFDREHGKVSKLFYVDFKISIFLLNSSTQICSVVWSSLPFCKFTSPACFVEKSCAQVASRHTRESEKSENRCEARKENILFWVFWGFTRVSMQWKLF